MCPLAVCDRLWQALIQQLARELLDRSVVTPRLSPQALVCGAWKPDRVVRSGHSQSVGAAGVGRVHGSQRGCSGDTLTSCDNVRVPVSVSVRLDERLVECRRWRARATTESVSDRLRPDAEDGGRRDEHPLIAFRDGPTGVRAGVVGGPDVWEVAMWVEELSGVTDPIATLAQEQDLSRAAIEAALRYRDAYPDEIDARIVLHRDEATRLSASRPQGAAT